MAMTNPLPERQALQALLEAFQAEFGEDSHVYFQPPENVKMVYPCFVYKEVRSTADHANDKPYLITREFQVTYITRSADPSLPKAIENLPRVRFNNRYAANNLNHFVFTFTGMPIWTPSERSLDGIPEILLGGN